MKFKKQSGQALLVVVLLMVVALTVGLSLTARSVVNLRTSTEEADSQKALAAAEAGIEQALQAYSSAIIGDSFVENNTKYDAKIKEVEGAAPFLLNGGNLVLQDDGVDVWLVKHDEDGRPDYDPPWPGKKLNIYWGDPSLNDDCKNAAIEVAVISGSIASPSLKRYAFDPCGPRAATNKFSKANVKSNTIEGKKFLYEEKIGAISSGLVARVVPIYTSTSIAVDGDGDDLPTQGFAIDSTGTSGAGGDRQVLRSITFFRTFDELPTPYFMYGLFSPCVINPISQICL